MPKPRVFIGSSQTNHAVAKVIKEELCGVADVKTWKDDCFDINESYLESLFRTLKKYDFAVFILAPDDMTTSKDETRPSPRDNVLFESGFFMSALGRARVFLVFDEPARVKIPSDLIGITLASYDGSLMKDKPDKAVAEAVRRIKEKIKPKASAYKHLAGDWVSRYIVTMKDGNPTVDEVVSVMPCGDSLIIVSKENLLSDDYEAKVRENCGKHFIGTWKSKDILGDDAGLFVLTAKGSDVLYGYFTSPDSEGRTYYATWVLVKKEGKDEETIKRLLSEGQKSLSNITVGQPLLSGTTS